MAQKTPPQLQIADSILAEDLLVSWRTPGPLKQAQASLISGVPFLAGSETTMRSAAARFGEYIDAQGMGMVGDYVADDTAALQAAILLMLQTGKPLYLPTGRYKITSKITIDLSLIPGNGIGTVGPTTGFKIFGNGHQKSKLDMRGVTSYPNFEIISTGSSNYPILEDISIIGNQPGYVFGLGGSNLGTQELNFAMVVRCSVQNFNTTSASRAVVVNGLYGGYIDLVANCGTGGYVGGQGVTLTLRQSQFVHYYGSYGSADTGIQFQDGVNAGNEFHCVDMENLSYNIRASSGLNINNLFQTGRYAYSGFSVQASNASDFGNRITEPYIGATAPATAAGFFDGSALGWELITRNANVTVTTPAVPASNVDATNTTGRQIRVNLRIGSAPAITSVIVGGITTGGGPGQYTVRPGETIRSVYASGAPTWTWVAD